MPGHVRSLGRRKDGSTIWQARWRPADDASDRKREERSFKTKREAERWISSRDSDVLRGAYAPAAKGATLLPALADELRTVWTAKGLEPKTRAGYEAILSRWLIGPSDPLHPDRPCRFHRTKVGVVTTKLVQEFVNDLSEQRAPNTVRRIYGVLNALMKLAAQRGYVAVNPCDAVEMPSKKRAGIRRSHLYLEGPELLRLAEAVPAHWRLPVLVAGSCGCPRHRHPPCRADGAVRVEADRVEPPRQLDQGTGRRPSQVRRLSAQALAPGAPHPLAD